MIHRDTRERRRLAALHGHAILDTGEEAPFELIVATAARFFGTPIALVSLVDADRLWFKARVGVASTELPRAASCCDEAILGDGVLIVPDAAADPRFRDHEAMRGREPFRFYAGAPIRTAAGDRIGVVCVVDHRPRRDTPPGAIAFLESLARRTMEVIELRSAMAAFSGRD